ncbi:MAG: hypothetical protein BJ554DRAFT_2961 [Olpidium bornovanus]|uniref:Aromatic amino acid beta-eliminating lyase/threonine aldolase domain-containing protein n=1 Tax=Olpidium bornovanus TaxID=278681 RepID=A0A8H8A0G7_9FUNG|nr:MAG: hypothetical protein BJ554DRAFT_2961 [Olpidium bornovanus]
MPIDEIRSGAYGFISVRGFSRVAGNAPNRAPRGTDANGAAAAAPPRDRRRAAVERVRRDGNFPRRLLRAFRLGAFAALLSPAVPPSGSGATGFAFPPSPPTPALLTSVSLDPPKGVALHVERSVDPAAARSPRTPLKNIADFHRTRSSGGVGFSRSIRPPHPISKPPFFARKQERSASSGRPGTCASCSAEENPSRPDAHSARNVAGNPRPPAAPPHGSRSWRQAGLVAAAAAHALDTNFPGELRRTHAEARTLARLLSESGFLITQPTETNMVWASSRPFGVPVADLAAAVESEMIDIVGYGDRDEFELRLVVHLQSGGEEGVRRLAQALERAAKAAGNNGGAGSKLSASGK